MFPSQFFARLDSTDSPRFGPASMWRITWRMHMKPRDLPV